MSTISKEELVQALVAVTREALEDKETVEWPAFGTFQVEHQPSRMREQPDGQAVLEPPREIVVFEPAKATETA